MYNRFMFDKPSKSVHFSLNGVDHMIEVEKFIKDTGFPFDVNIVCYEPERQIFVVERLGNVVIDGRDLPEIQWVIDNIDNIIQSAYNNGYGYVYTPTLAEMRTGKLYETDWMVTRHKEQIECGLPTSLTDTQYNNLLRYRQQLRDITKTYSTIDDVVWPLMDL